MRLLIPEECISRFTSSPPIGHNGAAAPFNPSSRPNGRGTGSSLRQKNCHGNKPKRNRERTLNITGTQI
jgi:hypothetical protein